MFRKVDGASNQAVTVDVALGRDPEFPSQRGEFPRAAKFFWRLFEDGVVRKVPKNGSYRRARGDWLVRTTTRTRLTSNETCFHLRADLDAYEGTSRVYSRSWHTVIPRRLV